MKPRLIILSLLILVLANCEKPERDNPWDELATLTPDEWAPTNLTITANDLSSITLTWQQSIEYIEGFRIDRLKETEEWQTAIATVDKNEKTYIDKQVDLPAIYTYRVYAFAGKNTSSYVEVGLGLPTISTTEISDITGATANSGGNITSDGGSTVTSRGVVWGISQHPTLYNNVGITSDGAGAGSFISNLSGLTPNASYYVRSYATNGAGTSYGNELNFSTIDGLPVLTTTNVTAITAFTSTSGGNITSDGGFSVTARGVVWSTTQNPTISNNQGITNNGTGIGIFTSNLTDLQIGTVHYVRSYATNDAGTSYGNQLNFTTNDGLPVITTTDISAISETSATSGGNITSDGGFSVTDRGVVWSTYQNPTILNNQGITSNGTDTGSFTSNLTNLQSGTVYYVRAYASNSIGSSYGEQRSFTSGGTLVVEVTNPATGKTWMDRNLGASRVAQSSTDAQAYGDLYQWGRLADGHQNRTSGTTPTLSNNDVPGHGSFIIGNSDWRNPQNNNLWQGVGGINNPCPSGYRLPTEAEWEAERQSWNSNNPSGAFNSPLKLPVAGLRDLYSGSLNGVGGNGAYWSAAVGGTIARSLLFGIPDATMYSSYRAQGCTVRCIKD